MSKHTQGPWLAFAVDMKTPPLYFESKDEAGGFLRDATSLSGGNVAYRLVPYRQAANPGRLEWLFGAAERYATSERTLGQLRAFLYHARDHA